MTATVAADAAPRRFVEHVMGMPVSLALRGRHTSGAAAEAAWRSVVASLRAADRVFSTYRDDSDISRLGRGEIGVDDCHPEVAEVFRVADLAREESGGAFDVTWTGPHGQRIIDPSGIVKGWAVERAATALAELEDTDYCLSAGGDLVGLVCDPGRPAWRIGIEHPLDPKRLVASVPLRRGGLATSGPAHRGAHIIDPRTGTVPTTFASVTVVAESLTWADIDATAAFVLGHEALSWLVGRRGRTGVLVWPDGRAETFASEDLP